MVSTYPNLSRHLVRFLAHFRSQLTAHIMPSYTTKWRSYRDHRFCDVNSPVAPPGFCNRGEVRYGSIGGPEYEVLQSRCTVCVSTWLDGLAMYLSCDTKKFHDNESTHIFGRLPIGGKLPPFPPGGATGHCYKERTCAHAVGTID